MFAVAITLTTLQWPYNICHSYLASLCPSHLLIYNTPLALSSPELGNPHLYDVAFNRKGTTDMTSANPFATEIT